jgi:hypothetical protein
MNTGAQFMVRSAAPPKVELSDAGLYVRFKSGVSVARTVIQNEWPHMAVDLAENDEVIGIELVPVPEAFSINTIVTIVADARVGGLPHYEPGEVLIESCGCAA